MLIYFLLDTSTSLIFWIIKNLGYVTYSSIRYLIYGTEDSDEEENKRTLKMLIEQKTDIEEIKEYIKTLEKK